jgi:multiple antibiotic resistance protein
LITLSAHAHGDNMGETTIHTLTLGMSLLTVCIITYFCFAYSGVVIRKIGPSGSNMVNRLSAFLLFCIGVQMAVTGLKHTFPNLL